jgi:hypothetical protein
MLKKTPLTLALLFFSLFANAHHSPFLYFDPSKSVVVEGVISGLKWRNPHAVFTLASDDQEWTLETHSVSILRRMNLTKDTVKVGDKVRVAGWPSKGNDDHEIFITNMLMPNGEEVVFDAGAPVLWSDERVGDGAVWLTSEDNISETYTDIFHVWSTSLAGGDGNFLFENYNFKLTESAADARAAFDMFNHPIIGTCVYKGMPTIMEQPYPMQFAKSDNLIIMHMEEGNAVRTFDMNPNADYSNEEPTNMGYSVGRWEDNTLVVTTTGVSWEWVDLTGVPQTPKSVIVERFTPNNEGKRLDYTMTITNPDVFTEPPVFSKSWLAVPGEHVSPYNCEEG